MSYFLRDTGDYGEMGTYVLAKVLYKSQNLCGNFCKARSPTYEAICIYALAGFSVPLFSNTQAARMAGAHATGTARDNHGPMMAFR